ncbi:MFS transporter [Cohnella sp. JJ-181]|uniref:MFS transporter n=1 Tax=Cohnella rhizoplanae TaxID=2974897 RepID=UPI0022FF814C|nr:putative glycolipid permease LtaA [Cohnella sp. JJ-181]
MKTASIRTMFTKEMSLLALILYLVEFVRGAALIGFLPIYGKETLGLDLDVIGAAITAHYLIDTALKLGMGYLVHRFPVRRIIHIGLLASLIGMALIGWADVPWIFISAAGLYGLGISPIWIYCLTKVKEEGRGAQMGFLYMIWLVGLGSGPVVLNLVLVHSERASYWIMVLVSAGAWLLSFMIPKEARAEVAAVPFRKQLAVLGTHLKDMRFLLPGMILQTLAAGMLQPILPSFVKDHLGMAPWQYTLLLLAGGGFTALGLIPMGRLSDRLGKKWFLVAGFLLFGVALYGLTLGPAPALAFIGAVTLGLSYAAVLPAWNALLAAYVPPGQKGLGWGVLSAVEGLGGLLGPIIGGFAATGYGEPSVVLSTAVIFAVIGVIYLLFPFRLFRGESPAQRM